MKPVHIHHDCIVAWARNSKIQYQCQSTGNWYDTEEPMWYKDRMYRIKPETIIKYGQTYMYSSIINLKNEKLMYDNLKLTFINDKLTKAEVI